jgi:hypothetical protein
MPGSLETHTPQMGLPLNGRHPRLIIRPNKSQSRLARLAATESPMKFLAAMLFLAIPAGSTAAEVSKQITAVLIVTISGEIKPGDETKFEDVIPVPGDPRSVIVNLDSRGGFNRPAALMGFVIRDRGFETRLERGSNCNSACTLIFFAGKYRSMAPGTQLGFHSAAPETSLVRHEETNRLIGIYLRQMGAPEQVIELQPKADPTTLNYVTRDQAQRWGILKDRPPAATEVKTRPKLLEAIEAIGTAARKEER